MFEGEGALLALAHGHIKADVREGDLAGLLGHQKGVRHLHDRAIRVEGQAVDVLAELLAVLLIPSLAADSRHEGPLTHGLDLGGTGAEAALGGRADGDKVRGTAGGDDLLFAPLRLEPAAGEESVALAQLKASRARINDVAVGGLPHLQTPRRRGAAHTGAVLQAVVDALVVVIREGEQDPLERLPLVPCRHRVELAGDLLVSRADEAELVGGGDRPTGQRDAGGDHLAAVGGRTRHAREMLDDEG